MAALSQSQIAEQMVAQLRLLKPTISAEVGTPERLILDTVAGALAESSIDLIGLQEALNVDSKFGTNLTNFMALFGFSRTVASTATGFVKFSRNSPANVDIQIPSGVILKSHIPTTTDGILQEFATTAGATLHAGSLETELVPIRALQPGAPGNVPAEAITIMVFGASILGITGVTNPAATTGGAEQESDNELKTRFKNSVFRNLAGTEDQFLALSVATAFSTKANVIGPISKYQEYLQVPVGDDQTLYPFGGGQPYPGFPYPLMVRGSTTGTVVTVPSTIGIEAEDPVELYKAEDSPALAFSGKVTAVTGPTTFEIPTPVGEPILDGWVFVGDFKPYFETLVNKWTTALSTNPFAKEIWRGLPVFISNITAGVSKFFFREGVDFEFNYPPLLQGDTLRAMIDGVGPDPRTNITGKNQPNVTFINVYKGSEPEAVAALAPEDIVLFEYAYCSSASRNSLLHNVTNAVDVYIDGTNEQATSTIFSAPLAGNSQAFVDDPVSMYYYENYRRDGDPTKRPLEGNILTSLFSPPVLGIPGQITVGADKYYLNTHYWLVHDTSGYFGTIRARDGIEWSATIPGDRGKAEEGVPTPEKPEPHYTGKTFAEQEAPTLVEVEPYFYDQNIEDLQAALEASRQITTDVLAHKAKVRYFKLNITVVYAPQATPSTVNNSIHEALSLFFSNQNFGNVVRLSDLLAQIHNVSGVQNVRWSNDVPNDPSLVRVQQTTINGKPLEGVFMDRIRWGIGGHKEIQALYVVGDPQRGSYQLVFGKGPAEKTGEIKPVEEGTTALKLQEEINKVLGAGAVTVSEDKRSTTGVTEPIRSFRIEYAAAGTKVLPTVLYPLAPSDKPMAGGEYIFDSDFFLRDDELPALPTGEQEGDTVPGLIIKSRAENVWEKA